jgi:hypothetical protein
MKGKFEGYRSAGHPGVALSRPCQNGGMWLTDNGLARAFLKIGAISLMFGIKEAVCLSLGYYLIYWLIGGQSDWE